MQEVETKRLRLRLATPTDAEFVQTLYASEDFHRYIGDKGITSLKEAAIYIENNFLKMHREKGVCLLIVEKRDSFQPIGVCGLIKRDTLESHDIGYGFLPSEYGKGYAFEASMAILNQAKHNPDIDHLAAITTSDNIRSITLLKKLGFSFERVEAILSDNVNLNLYGLDVGSDSCLNITTF